MDRKKHHHNPETMTDVAAQTGKPAQLNSHSTGEACHKRLLNRKMNEEMLHYTARVRCGY